MTVVVTGGARGIGLGVVEQLLAEGCRGILAFLEFYLVLQSRLWGVSRVR